MTIAGAVLAAMLAASSATVQETPYAPAGLPAPGVSACPGGLCQADALEGLFEALAATEAGRRDRPVAILQIGDSHTAGDGVSGALRASLQARFGRAGRGVLPAGAPFDGYAPYQVQVTTEGWLTEKASLQPPAGRPSPATGLAGIRGVATPGAVMNLMLEPGSEALLVGVCGRARGPGPGIEVWGVGQAEALDLNGPATDDEVCRDIVLPAPAALVSLTGLGSGAVVDSVRIERLTPGVTVSNLGQVGATLRDLAARDEAVAATELAVWRPSLIILAFGANDGFDDGLDPVVHERLLRSQIERMRRLAPAASLMILGAPDALRAGAPGCSADGTRGPPRNLAVVRDVQRRVAADMGVAFWDWHGRMGGDCSADRLARRIEPFVRGDRVHFTSAGADWIGGILADDLRAAYDAWSAGRGPVD